MISDEVKTVKEQAENLAGEIRDLVERYNQAELGLSEPFECTWNRNYEKLWQMVEGLTDALLEIEEIGACTNDLCPYHYTHAHDNCGYILLDEIGNITSWSKECNYNDVSCKPVEEYWDIVQQEHDHCGRKKL